MFTKISQAYAVLSDPKKRQEYDRQPDMSQVRSNSSKKTYEGYQWKNPEFSPEFDHFKDLP